MILRFTVSGPPMPKARPRLGRVGRVFTPRATVAYERLVRLCASAAMPYGGWDLTGWYALEIDLYFPDMRRRDLDNCAKAIMDALNGVAWVDDSLVNDLRVSRHHDKEHPRAEVVIEEVLS